MGEEPNPLKDKGNEIHSSCKTSKTAETPDKQTLLEHLTGETNNLLHTEEYYPCLCSEQTKNLNQTET